MGRAPTGLLHINWARCSPSCRRGVTGFACPLRLFCFVGTILSTLCSCTQVSCFNYRVICQVCHFHFWILIQRVCKCKSFVQVFAPSQLGVDQRDHLDNVVLQAAEAEFDAYLQAAAHCESEGFEICTRWHFLISSELVTICIVFFQSCHLLYWQGLELTTLRGWESLELCWGKGW